MAEAKKGASHKALLQQLKRIEGQIRGIAGMVEEERYCVDILTQLKATRSSLASVEKKIFEQHIEHCVHKAVVSKNKKMASDMVDEVKELVRFMK